jgi:hypothetical protein
MADLCVVIDAVKPSLWSSSQFLATDHRSAFDYHRYQILWEVVGLKRGPLSLMNATEELLERKSSNFSIENREYDSRDPSRWPCGTLCPQMLAVTSLTSGGHLVGIVC